MEEVIMGEKKQEPEEKKMESRIDALERRLAELEESASAPLDIRRPAARRRGAADPRRHCKPPDITPRAFGANVSAERARLIRRSSKKWVNGTTLRFYFFDQATAGPGVPQSWFGAAAQRQEVRDAFADWKGLGIGLDFREVQRPEDAEIKIAFADDGSWSYVGKDTIDYAGGPSDPTMNFGWDLTTPYGRDTARHEIGHALGFPHEHQNPLSGIVWDEEAVYEYFGGPPNYWSRAAVCSNILDKIPRSDVEGSAWDRDSIMHYWFPAGLILEPARYRNEDLDPEPGLSEVDIAEVRRFYPVQNAGFPELRPFEARVLDLSPGQQADFSVLPRSNREYSFRTFGSSDTVMVLFEEEQERDLRYRAGDDDSGYDRNAAFDFRLVADRRYVLRIRLFWASAYGRTAVMMW
jgi:hypothetical protein